MWMTLLLLLAAAVPADDRAPATEDLQALQGVWQLGQADGKRIEVENRGQIQTFRAYDGGQLVHEHRVEYELGREGVLRVFRWKNGEVTFGPRKGNPVADGGFVYRLKDGKWTCVTGLLPGEEGLPLITQHFEKMAE